MYTENMLDIKRREPNRNHYIEPRRSFYSEPPHIPKRRKSKAFFWIIIILIIFGVVFVASISLAYKFYSTSKKIIDSGQNTSFIQSIKDITSTDRKVLRGEKSERINILLVGLAGKNYPGSNLTDSIIVASINPKTYQTALLSVPRDLYVKIPETNYYTKINALYARSEDFDQSGKMGIEDLKKTLSDITGLDINYYVAIDFEGFKQIIDELGGIKIQVPKDLHDERYPGPNYSYETFDIKQGLYTLDGATALKYARTRHDEDGDFGRAYRQQQILEAVRQKSFSIGTLMNLPAINNILETLGNHLRTDVPLDEINSFLDLVGKIDTHTTINKVLDAGKPDSVMAVSHVMLGGVRAFILIPRTGSYDEIQDLAKNIFDLGVLQQKKAAVETENVTISVVNASGSANFGYKLTTLFKKLGYDASLVSANRLENQLIAKENNSTVYDNVKTKPFSLEDISKKLGAKISEILPDNLFQVCRDADLCFVAGSNLAYDANYEEDSTNALEQGYDKQALDEKKYIELLKKGSSSKF
jgi:polyisoprenyl-teichoic acid--peptidoglycan teichoic acid transferase